MQGSLKLDDYLGRWGLTPDGDPIVTHSSQLLPVRQGDTPAMLKLAVEAEEKFGGLLMSWWAGRGAVPVLAHEGLALLMERAENNVLLTNLARQVDVVVEAAGLERKRLLQWILAWAGLSAAWWLKDGESPESDLIVAELAMVELAKH